jgi:hypothetical protein
MAAQTYDGPSLVVRLQPTTDGSSSWELYVIAHDHSGGRQLAYRARGPSLARFVEFDLAVRDELRDVWTTMPDNQRLDLRVMVSELAAGTARLVEIAAR